VAGIVAASPVGRAFAETSSKTTAKQKPRSGAPKQALDFDLFNDGAASTQRNEALEEKVRQRRMMLDWHQRLGFGTLAGLALTEVVGQLQLHDKYRGGGGSERFEALHLGLALTTTALYTSVALLGVFAPEPFEKRKTGFDTATLHKILMTIATVGMLTQVGLGIYTNAREGELDQRHFASAHQIIGYATLGSVTLGAVVLLF
jgi:hypothetical protein